jgi:hypothetical protein
MQNISAISKSRRPEGTRVAASSGDVLFAVCLCVLLAPFGAVAEEIKPESAFSFSGFGTAGLTHNNTDKAEFIRDIGQPRGVANDWSGDVDSRIGLQVNVRATWCRPSAITIMPATTNPN